MDALKLLKNKENLNWEYDSEADVLYISIGKPLKALTLDCGDGLLVRYLEDSKEVVGITLLSFQEKTLKSLVAA